MSKRIFYLLFVLEFYTIGNAQIIPGQWREMLPYYNVKNLIPVQNKIYCQSEHALVVYDINSQSVSKLSKVQGLSDVGIASVAYHAKYNSLVVGYTSTNIDIVRGKEIINISDIKNKLGIGSRFINSISIINDDAYVCCGFGIVVIDLGKLEIKDTYYLGSGSSYLSVFDICLHGNTLYAATEKGIYTASYSDPNLVNYANWTKESALVNPDRTFKIIKSFAGNVYALAADTTNKTLLVLNGNTWSNSTLTGTTDITNIEVSNDKLILINKIGLNSYNASLSLEKSYNDANIFNACSSQDGSIWFTKFGVIQSILNGVLDKKIFMSGPWSAQSFGVTAKDGVTWISHGGYTGDNYLLMYNDQCLSVENNNEWSLFNPYYNSSFAESFDFTQVVFHPTNPKRVYAASLVGKGLFEINNNKDVVIYNSSNTGGVIQSYYPDQYRIGGLSFDANNNLWISCQSSTYPIAIMKSDGTFKGYKCNDILKNIPVRGPILATSSGQVWLVLGEGKGIFVFDNNNTPDVETDDVYKHISISVRDVDNNSPYNSVKCITEDKEGNIWLGTRNGPIVYYNPNEILKSTIQADRVKIPKYDGTDKADPLLENETIYGIAIDGANRKWIATANSGVFLLSADGKKQLNNFREEKSPLFSNTVRSVAVDNKTGEVFFATAKGVVVYRGYANEGLEVFGKVYAYPNPVKEGYDGDIIITGLIANTIVKITDIAGNLVYETTSLGGQAVWNGRTMSGQRVYTGVYLAFCATPDGSQTTVTKILFIR